MFSSLFVSASYVGRTTFRFQDCDNGGVWDVFAKYFTTSVIVRAVHRGGAAGVVAPPPPEKIKLAILFYFKSIELFFTLCITYLMNYLISKIRWLIRYVMYNLKIIE